MQQLDGDGMAFIHAGGTVIRRELNNERIRLDTGCLVAFTPEGIDFDITMVKGMKSMFFGGEGMFLAVLKGTGTVWMQSLPFSRMADRIIQSAPSAGGSRVGEGNRLTGGVGGMYLFASIVVGMEPVVLVSISFHHSQCKHFPFIFFSRFQGLWMEMAD